MRLWSRIKTTRNGRKCRNRVRPIRGAPTCAPRQLDSSPSSDGETLYLVGMRCSARTRRPCDSTRSLRYAGRVIA